MKVTSSTENIQDSARYIKLGKKFTKGSLPKMFLMVMADNIPRELFVMKETS